MWEVKMKNKKLWYWVAWNQRFKIKNNYAKNNQKLLSIYSIKKNFCVSVCMYKMVQINKEGYKKGEIEIIDKGRYFWVNRKDLEVESDVANWA